MVQLGLGNGANQYARGRLRRRCRNIQMEQFSKRPFCPISAHQRYEQMGDGSVVTLFTTTSDLVRTHVVRLRIKAAGFLSCKPWHKTISRALFLTLSLRTYKGITNWSPNKVRGMTYEIDSAYQFLHCFPHLALFLVGTQIHSSSETTHFFFPKGTFHFYSLSKRGVCASIHPSVPAEHQILIFQSWVPTHVVGTPNDFLQPLPSSHKWQDLQFPVFYLETLKTLLVIKLHWEIPGLRTDNG